MFKYFLHVKYLVVLYIVVQRIQQGLLLIVTAGGLSNTDFFIFFFRVFIFVLKEYTNLTKQS